MMLTALSLALMISRALGHAGHEDDQMPMGYYKYPYQATYPGDNEGKPHLYTFTFSCLTFLFSSSSYRRFYLLRHNYFRKASLGTMPWPSEQRGI